MAVHVASPLKAQLQLAAHTAETVLVAKFTEWKVTNPGKDHYWFSRDVKGDDGNLYHAHLMPQNELLKRAAWDNFWHKKQRARRRSDRYILYAQAANKDFLLIALIEDPGAHKLWTPAWRAQRVSFEIVAENFVIHKSIP